MNALLQATGHLALLLLGGIALSWLLRLVELLVRISPMPESPKSTLLRFAPAAELIVALAYIASGLAFLLGNDREFAWTVMALVLALVVLSWSSLYDLTCGVAFRVAQSCQVGDMVRVGEVEGRVLEIGTRALVLQTRRGDEAVVPYGSIARQTLRRTQSVSGAYMHTFEIHGTADEEFALFKRQVIEAALRSHWASVVHIPKLERREGAKVEVTIYAMDADHAPLVEATVRHALARAAPPTLSDRLVAPPTGRRPGVGTPE